MGYAYDHAGRLTTLTTWKNSTAQTGAKSTHWVYEESTGFLASRHLGGEAPIYYSYTAGGRPRSVLVNDAWGPGTQWQYGFDAAPPTRRTADVSQVQYTGTVDLDGQPATPDLEFSYDRAGRRIGATQITGGSTNSTVSWTRNSFGLVTAENWTAGPLSGHTLAYTYDDRLRRTNLTFRVGVTTNGVVGYAFDTAGRISWLGDGSSSATYTYAPNASLVQQVQLRHGASVALTVSRQYDRWNRIHTQTAVGSASGVVGQEYTHNATGQRIRTQQMDGSYWLYDYDSLGQVKSAKRFWADGSPVAGQQFEYAHDDIGNRTTGKSGGDVSGGSLHTTTETTDADSLLTQRSNPRQYEVQGAARIGTEVKVNGVVATRQGEYFRYEGTASGTAARWLDHSLSLNGSTLISGRKKYVPPQTESVGHDIVGNRIQDGRWEMAWDGENRLIDVRTRDAAVSEGVPKQRLRYTYDPDGRLIERRRFSWSGGTWVLSETTRYLNDGWQCVGEFNGSNTLQRRQVWGIDLDGSRGGMGGIGGLLWIASQANGTHYATSDGSGNVVGLFDTSGSISARYVYSPFGELLQLSGGGIATENPWRFSSKRQDPTTDWIHYEYRIYDPMSGRWLSRDPIGEAGGENLYGFAGNDPVNRVDLWGLACGGCPVEAPGLMPETDPLKQPNWLVRNVLRPALEGVQWTADAAGSLMKDLLYGSDYQWGARGYPAGSKADLDLLGGLGGTNYRDGNGEEIQFSSLVLETFCTAGAGLGGAWSTADDLVRIGSGAGAGRTAAGAARGTVKGAAALGGGAAKRLPGPRAISKLTDNAARLAEVECAVAAKTKASLVRGWRVGDPINNLTARGNVPAWDTVRNRFWKNEALNNPRDYSSENLSRMRGGLAPRRINPNTGKLESMTLHHTPPQRSGGLFDVQKLWPDEHAVVDPFYRTGN